MAATILYKSLHMTYKFNFAFATTDIKPLLLTSLFIDGFIQVLLYANKLVLFPFVLFFSRLTWLWTVYYTIENKIL
jgi:hypothetical protein